MELIIALLSFCKHPCIIEYFLTSPDPQIGVVFEFGEELARESSVVGLHRFKVLRISGVENSHGLHPLGLRVLTPRNRYARQGGERVPNYIHAERSGKKLCVS